MYYSVSLNMFEQIQVSYIPFFAVFSCKVSHEIHELPMCGEISHQLQLFRPLPGHHRPAVKGHELKEREHRVG